MMAAADRDEDDFILCIQSLVGLKVSITNFCLSAEIEEDASAIKFK
jgi:hypothetical protein